MSFFKLGIKRTQTTSSTTTNAGRSAITLRDVGTWSVTSSAAYRRIAIAATQLEYEVKRGEDQIGQLSAVLATAIAAKIAYGVSIIDADTNKWAVLDNDRLEIYFDEKDRVSGFKYKNLAGHEVFVKNFLYSMNSAPGRVAAGALSDAIEDIKAENMTQAVAAALAENLSFIGLVARVKGENDPVKLQKLSDTISAAFTGANRGGVLAINDSVTLENMLNVTSLNPIGTENLKASRQAIAAAFGVPYDLLYSDSSNRASVDSAKDLLFRDTIVPAAKAFVSDLGNTGLYGRITLSEKSLTLGQTPEKLEADAKAAEVKVTEAAVAKPAVATMPVEAVKPVSEL